MPTYRVTVAQPWALPVNGPVSSNTFHVSVPVAGDTALGLVSDAFNDMYDAIGHWGSIFTGQREISFVNLADSTPRTAEFSKTYSFSPGATSLPGEVALRVSYRAEYAVNVRRSRFTGSVNLGPFAQNTLDDLGVFTEAVANDVLDGFLGLQTAFGVLGCDLKCGSEAYGWKNIAALKVTNEASTVRRRQMLPTVVLGTY